VARCLQMMLRLEEYRYSYAIYLILTTVLAKLKSLSMCLLKDDLPVLKGTVQRDFYSVF
jgi:hypothetical protein